MIDLSPDDLKSLLVILRQHLPGIPVIAFGSRVNGSARKFSDLDLVIQGDQQLLPDTLAALREALSHSDLSVLVDLHDWHDLPDHFRKIIASGKTVRLL